MRKLKGRRIMRIETTVDVSRDADALFDKYMYLIGKNDTESIYRLKAETGDGIMRRYNVSKGIEIIYSEIESYSPSYNEHKRFVNYIEIMYIVEGQVEFVMDNRRYASASKGDVVIFNSHVGTKVCNVKNGGIRSISIIVNLEDLADDLNRLFETGSFNKSRMFSKVPKAESCICFPAGGMLQRIFTELMVLPEKYGEYQRKLLTYQAVVALLDVNGGKISDYQYFSGDTGNKIHEARKLLGQNLSSDLPIELLSKKVKLNRTTLQRVFRQVYGVTVYEYRTHVRMQEAKNLLLDDDLSVTDIAGRCGYSNASKFAACFKKITGMTPGEWRRKQF